MIMGKNTIVTQRPPTIAEEKFLQVIADRIMGKNLGIL